MDNIKLGELRQNTIKKLKAAGIDEAMTVCDMLLMHFFGFSRLFIMTNNDFIIENSQEDQQEKAAGFTTAVIRVCKGEPVQYIIGEADFYGLKFKVTPAVLIPRGDTEILEEALIKEANATGSESPVVLDMCTGSGCIGITLKHNVPGAQVSCSDISPEALSVALENCKNILGGYEKVSFFCGSFFEPFNSGEKFDIIVSNPPYIPSKDIETLDVNVKDHEPLLALDGGNDGLDPYRIITAEAPPFLNENGTLMFEVGIGQANDVAELMKKAGFSHIKIIKDFGNIERVVSGRIAKKKSEKPKEEKASETDTKNPLDSPVTVLPGIKAARASQFKNLGVNTLADLLELYPTRYEDRSKRVAVSDAEPETEVTILVRITSKASRMLRKGLTATFFTARDATGNIKITFYNQDYIKRAINVGGDYLFYGKITQDGYGGGKQMLNPAFTEASDTRKVQQFERLLPIYPLTKGLSQNVVRNAVSEAMRIADAAGLLKNDNMAGADLPLAIRERQGLPDRLSARKEIHFPTDRKAAESARRRLIFDELLELQLMLFHIKNSVNTDYNAHGIVFPAVDMSPFYKKLPYQLTQGQKKVIDDIFTDMEAPRIMNRLVIGDVGSGKTVIAVAAMYKAIKSGYQAVYMAPTEILAEQHFRNITQMLEPLVIKVGLLTGSLTASAKKKMRESVANGEIQCVIGTHALIQKGVTFHKAGIVITDEQHRFGVRQRSMLSELSSVTPDILVMTATPIPRTLALILYGDLDISTLDVLPTGRLPVKTYPATGEMRSRVYNWVLANVKEGRQAYVVHPLVDDKDEEGNITETGAVSAVSNYEKLSKTIFSEIKTGLLHGKMKAAEKDAVMRQFAAGEISVLFATTVIEVGVDVANATIMVIENAERFGLSQLHQLRGRVGRSSLQSHCTLISDAKNPVAKERIKLLCSTNNGFDISEKDLELRGPGELFGTAQHGLPTFKIANLYDDIDVLKDAQKAAKEIAEVLSSEGKSTTLSKDCYKEYLDYYNYAIGKTPKLINL